MDAKPPDGDRNRQSHRRSGRANFPYRLLYLFSHVVIDRGQPVRAGGHSYLNRSANCSRCLISSSGTTPPSESKNFLCSVNSVFHCSWSISSSSSKHL